MKPVLKKLAVAAALLLVAVLACGGETESTTVVQTVVVEKQATVTERVVETVVVERQATATDRADAGQAGGADESRVQAAPLPQNRIVVHTARMSLVVEDVSHSINRVTDVAGDLGGWVVNSDRTSKHSGSIAIRVPAGRLNEAMRQIEGLAIDVESRALTSEDVTDEYVDSESRLASMRITEERLLSFLDRALNVEDALRVQNEVAALQLQIEEIQGRLKFLEQTAAYSLIEVGLRVAPGVVEVDAGPDPSFRVGEVARFRASFVAPEGIEDVSFVWDFGDGASASGSGSAPTPDGRRVTATVNHVYDDDKDSPYIVTIELVGKGEAGIVEGSDTMLVSVSRVPTIEVFAGDDRTVEEGSRVEYSASFTRHDELWDYQYQWDFGDGTPTEMGEPVENAGRVELTHVFADHRPTDYVATLTIHATSDAGPVTGSDSFAVRVTEAESFFVAGWDVTGTVKAAVRTLSAIAKVALTVLIWAGILSPVMLVVLAVIYIGNRSRHIQAMLNYLFNTTPTRPIPPRPNPATSSTSPDPPDGDQTEGPMIRMSQEPDRADTEEPVDEPPMDEPDSRPPRRPEQ